MMQVSGRIDYPAINLINSNYKFVSLRVFSNCL